MSDGLDHTPPNPEVGLQASIGGYEQARMTALASIGNPTFHSSNRPPGPTPTGSPAPSPSLAPPADPAPGGGPHYVPRGRVDGGFIGLPGVVGAVAPPVVAPPKAPVCPPAPTKPPRRRILKAQRALPGKPPKPPSTPPRGTKRDVPGAPRKPRPDAARPPTPPRPPVEAPRSRAPYRATLERTESHSPYRATVDLIPSPYNKNKQVHLRFHSIAMMPEYRKFSPDELRMAHYDGLKEKALGYANDTGRAVETNFMLASITAMPEYRAFSFEELRMAHHDAAVGGVNAAPAASLVDAGAVAALLRNDGPRWAKRVQVAAVAVVAGTVERWRVDVSDGAQPARADAARLEAAAAECAAELEDRRDRFRAAHDDVEYFRTRLSSRQGAAPAMPDVLDAARLREAFDQADMYREEYELEMDVVDNYARRVAALFEARGVPPASRKSPYGFLDDRARRLAGERPPPDASEAWAALPFHDGGAPGFRPGIYEGPPGDLIYQCRSSLLHWTTTWRDVVDCAVCFDRLPRGETLGACVTGVCGHVGGACLSCFREFADQQLGDAARFTEAGLPCFAPHCRAALAPAQLGAHVLGRGPLLSPAKVAKVKAFARAARVRGPRKCWCPKQCDAVVDLAADARCPECDVAVCPDCRQEAHDGPCADALAGRDAAVWRDKWQRCPDCRNLVEKSAACDHMTCRCGARFCYNCGARGHGCPLECRRPRVFDPKEEDRPKNAAPPRRDDDDY